MTEPNAYHNRTTELPQVRFVLLHHDWPESHWDFLADLAPGSDRIATWSLDTPLENLQTSGRAQKLADHRRFYLDHEGPVAGNRGTLKRIKTGMAELSRASPEIFEFIILEASSPNPVRVGMLLLQRLSVTKNELHLKHRAGAETDWFFAWSPLISASESDISK